MTDIELQLTQETVQLTADMPSRTLRGVAVPLDGQVVKHSGHTFTFLPNSVTPAARTPLLEYHDLSRPVGKLKSHQWTSQGLEVEFAVSKTPAGDSALELANDGVLALSIGLVVDLNAQPQKDGVYQINNAGCKEISLTPLPALTNANITAVSLSDRPYITVDAIRILEGTTMPDIELEEVAAEVVTLKETTEDLNRRLATMGGVYSVPSAPACTTRYKNAGEWIKGLVQGEDEAFEVMRLDYTGGTTADSSLRPAYVQDAIRLVEQLRVSMNLFSSAPLPAEGMAVDFLKLNADNAVAAEQVHEGDTLAFSKVSLTHDTAPVKTYGSYTSMSLQEAKRSPANMLDLTYQAMVRQVAKVTDLAFITKLIAVADANAHIVRANASGTSTVDQWSDAFTDAEVALAATGIGLPAEFVLCDLTSFKTLSKLRGASSIPFLVPQGAVSIGSGVASGSTNTMGYIGLRGEVAGLPLYVDPNLAAGNVFVGNSAAITTYGDPTPVRLQGDPDVSQISTLTTAFSVYLFNAIADPYPTAVARIATS